MTATVAYAGRPGAFAEEACRAFLPDHEPAPHASFDEVAAAVLAGVVDLGVLPLKNSIAGPVPGVAALTAQDGLELGGTYRLPVRLHLLGLPGALIGALRAVSSHPMALAQCEAALDALGLRREPADNTASAARGLAYAGDPTMAALASERAATFYGLRVLRRDMQDRSDNYTSFGIIRRAKTAR